MKLPESTATIRSRGQQVVERDRQRARVDPLRPSTCRRTARRASGPRAAIRPRDLVGAGSRRVAPAERVSDRRARSRATSPSTPRSTGRCAPSASGVEVDLHDRGVRRRSACRAASSTCSARSPSRRRGRRRRSARRPAARRSRRRRPSDHGLPCEQALAPRPRSRAARRTRSASARRLAAPARRARRGRRRTPAARAAASSAGELARRRRRRAGPAPAGGHRGQRRTSGGRSRPARPAAG